MRRKLRPLLRLYILSLAAAPASAQIYTSTSTTGSFSNPQFWNFGAGPVPSSSAANVLELRAFGTAGVTFQNDLNLTVETLRLNSNGSTGSSVVNTLGGTFTFTGSGQFRQDGVGGASVMTAPIVLGSSATGLSFVGSGGSTTTISGAMSANTPGTPVTFNLTTPVPGFGAIGLSGANTFSGPVTLNSGNIALGNASAFGVLGSSFNTVTVNGGSLQGSQTVSNRLVLNSDLQLTGGATATTFGSASGLGLGGLSGNGGVQIRPAGTGQMQVFNLPNTYTGATTIAHPAYAGSASPENAGGLRVNGASGSILSTSSISVADGGALEINKNAGDSLSNSRISTATGIVISSGFLQVVGNSGFDTTALGTVTATGHATLIGQPQATGSSLLTINNLVRSNRATFTFSGTNLGGAAAGAGTTNYNVILGQLNGAAPNSALVGGNGGAGTTNISIIPYAVGDTVTTLSNFSAGTGFVTYDTNGVRLLGAAEYDADINTALPTANVRLAAAGTLGANNTVNSVFAGAGFGIGGTSTLTITSGAYATITTAATTTTANLSFPTEAVINTISPFTTAATAANMLTISGTVTAPALVKTGQGNLALTGTGNSIGSLTVNGGFIVVPQFTSLGLPNTTTPLVFNMHSFLNRGGLVLTGAVANVIDNPIQINSGHAFIGTNNAGGTVTVNGVISGAGGLNTTAAGVMFLNGVNTYTGGTRFNPGTVVIAADSAFGAPSSPILFNAVNGTLRLAGNWNTGRNMGFEGALGTGTIAGIDGFDTAGFNSTWSGPLVGSAGIFKTDSSATPGVWTITGTTSSYTGTITLGTNTRQGGTLAFTTGHLNAASIAFGTGATSVAGTYVLDLSGATALEAGTPWRSFLSVNTPAGFTQPHSILLGSSVGSPVDLRLGSGTIGQTVGSTTQGVISGFGKVVKVGIATATLNASNTFTGGVEIWGGTLAVGSDASLGSSTNTVSIQGGTIGLATGTYARDISLSPTLTPVLVVPANGIDTAAAVTISGNLTGPGGFNKTGTGALTLSGNNTYGGFTRIAAGTIAISSDSNLGGPASQLVLAGGTLQLSTGTATISRRILMPSASTIDVAGTSLQLDGQIVGQNQITKIGTGTLTINTFSPYFNNTTFAIGNGSAATGNVAFAAGAAFPRASVTIAASSGATLDLTSGSRELGSVSINGGALSLGSSTLTTGFTNAAVSVTGSLLGSSTATINKYGTGAITWTNASSTFAGNLNLAFGGLTVNGTGVLPAMNSFTFGGLTDLNNGGSSFTLDNAATNVTSRIADTQVVSVNNSAIIFTTNTTTASSESIASLRFSGLTSITMTTGGALQFTDASDGLVRVNRGQLFIRGGGAIGSAAATTAIPTVSFANLGAGSLVGGGGAAGTTTISILPYAYSADTGSAASTGNSLVTVGANGIRPLNTSTEFLNTFTGASANTNVRTGTSTQFTGGVDGLANALLVTGTANAAIFNSATTERLIVNSGVVGNSVTQVYGTATTASGPGGFAAGIQTAELLTGDGGTGANSRELIVHNMSASLAIGAKISTTGGLTKGGAGSLYLTNNSNSYTGGTTINGSLSGSSAVSQLVIDNLAAANNFAGGLTLGGGFLLYRGPSATFPAAASVTIAGGSATTPGGSGGFNIASGTNLTIGAGQIGGFGGLSKEGTGTLTINGAQAYSGPTVLHAGTIAINDPASLGTNSYVFVNTSNPGGTNGGAAIRFNAPITFAKNIDTFTGGTTVGISLDTNGNNVTFSGIYGSVTAFRGLTKLGAGDLTMTAANPYVGATAVYEGNLVLAGADGAILASAGSGGFVATASINALFTGNIVLDNTAVNNNNRLPDQFTNPIGTADSVTSTGIRLTGGGLTIRGNATVPTTEVVNRFEVFNGVVTLVNNGQNVTLQSGRVFRTDSSSLLLIRGNNIGSTPGPTTTNWFAIDMGSGSMQLGGAGGAIGTPFVNINPGTVIDSSPTGDGTELVTYDTAVGFRALTASEYTSSFAATNLDASRAPIIGISGAASTPSLTSWVTAMKLGAGSTLTGTGLLNLLQSTILATGNSSISVPVISATGNAGYDIWTSGSATTLTINSNLSSGKLYKGGQGTLVLNGTYSGTGNVLIQDGTLRLGGTNPAILTPQSASSSVLIRRGATLELGGADRTIDSIAPYQAVSTLGLNQQTDGLVSLGSSRLTLYGSTAATWTGSITGTGGLTKGFFSSGITTFTQPLAYGGSTVVNNGTLALGASGVLQNTSQIDVRGGTLLLNNADDLAVATGYVAQRVASTTPINLSGGLTITSNNNAVADHAFGTLSLVGGGTFTVTPGTAAPTTVTINALNRAADRGTLVLSGTGANFGLAPSPIGQARVFATQIEGSAPSAALFGGGGASGTTTVSIVPWAWGGTAASFMTYGPNGFRPLNTATGTGTEYGVDINAGTSTTNVRISAAAALTADRSVNSLIQASTGAVTGAFNLTVESGAVATTAASTIGVVGQSLLTGASNTRELVVFNGAATTLAYNVATTGGVTVHGTAAGLLTLTGTNTFSGPLTVSGVAGSGVSIASAANLGNPSLIRFGLGAGSATGLTYTGTTSIALNQNVELASYGAIAAPANLITAVNGTISGPGGISYNTASSNIEINGTNTYTGETAIQSANVSIASDAAFGNGGPLRLNATTSGFLILRGNWTTNRLIHLQSATTTQVHTSGFDAVWNGTVFGAGAVTKTGTGMLTITQPVATSATAGPTLNAGDVRLFNNGILSNAPTTAFTGGFGTRIILDDTGIHQPSRIGDTSSITGNNYELQLRGSSSTTTEEIINGLTMGIASTLTVQPGASQAAIFRVGGVLTRSAAGSIVFRGTNLGLGTPGTANQASVLIFAPNNSTGALAGGGGVAGSTSVSIIAGSFVDTIATGNGTQLATYDLDNGVRPLTTSEYVNNPAALNGRVVLDNVRLSSANVALANATTVNSLWLSGSGTTSGTGLLSLNSGTILATGIGNVVGSPLSAGANALVFGGPGSLQVDSVLPTGALGTGTTGGLIKRGDGTLILNAANTYTGNTTVASGTVIAGNNAAFSTTTLRFLGGSLQAGVPGLVIANAVGLSGDFTFSGSNDLTLSTSLSLESASRTVTVAAGRTLTLTGTVNSSTPSTGLIKAGPGVMVLAGNSATTYATATTFYLSTTVINGGELRVTNTAGSATGGSMVTVNAGGTLSGTGFIVPAQTLTARNLVTVNSGGTLSPGINNGVGLLTFGAATTPGVTTATLNVLSGGNLKFDTGGTIAGAVAGTGGSATAGTGNDSIFVNGALTIDPGATITITTTLADLGATPATDYSFKIAEASLVSPVAITDQSQFVVSDPALDLAYDFNVTASGTSVYLNFAAIPEPGTTSLVAAAGLGLLARRRRSRAR